jgi:adhesion G protein-coupled receptor A3
LACDCDLLWLIPWTEAQSIKLQPAPKCATPVPFKGKQLKNLKIGTDLHCESPLHPLLELRPDVDQLLFEGDQLTLRCRAPRLVVPNLSIRDSEDLPAAAKSHVFWGWSDKVLEPNSLDNITYYDPQIRFPSVTIDNRHLADSGLLDSVLRIPFVKRNHSGTWDCRLLSSSTDQVGSSLSRSIKVIIISEKTKYCTITQTQTNRGTYYWPKTIRNNVVKLPCAGDGVANNLVAMYRCNDMGTWEQLDLTACPYIRESTRILEQFSKVNLTLARGSVLQSAKRLRNYTFSDYTDMLPKFRDPIDVTFIAKTLTNFLEFMNTEAELGGILLDIISQTMQLPSSLLQKAQQLDSSCTQLLEIAETITSHASSAVTSVSQKSNLALESFKIRADTFAGLTCVWFKANLSADITHTDSSGPSAATQSRILQCNAGNKQNLAGGFGSLNERYIDVSIQLPSTLSPQLLATQPVAAQPQQLMISVYENSNFFPQQQQQQQQYQITSPIIGVKLSSTDAAATKNYGNLTDPIFIVLRFQPFHNELSLPKPVWWDNQQGE